MLLNVRVEYSFNQIFLKIKACSLFSAAHAKVKMSIKNVPDTKDNMLINDFITPNTEKNNNYYEISTDSFRFLQRVA